MYLHDWKDSGADGMKRDFGIDDSTLEGVTILLASYTYEDYSGDAFVLFERDGNLFEVNGSHCSCYGLSESNYCGDATTQWQPEETSIDEIRYRLEHGNFGEISGELRKVLDEWRAEGSKGGEMKASYIEVSAEVRYWEDANINGTDDESGTLTPFRNGDAWTPIIRLADGQVMDWPTGTTADIHFKVCDAGEYWLLNDDRKRVAKWAGFYVPDNFLCHGDTGYGDYIILKISADGVIEKWRTPDIEIVCGCDEDNQCSWESIDEGAK